jgi:hypothetical protein
VISVVTKAEPTKFIPTLSTGPERRIVFVEVNPVKPLLKEFTVDRLMGAFLT